MHPTTRPNQIILRPTDVLFFRDGRPMSGASVGHTAAWPLPDVINHALHAALHRAGLENTHAHRLGRSGEYPDPDQRVRKFGSLSTAGPFPVRVSPSGKGTDSVHTWYFARPRDANSAGNVSVTLRPLAALVHDSPTPWDQSSLPAPLKYAVVNTLPPKKEDDLEPWISTKAYQAYLSGSPSPPVSNNFCTDKHIADTEYAIGIAIDPATSTTGRDETKGKIYAAHYLRLRDDFRLGLFAEAPDKVNGDPANKRDLIKLLFNDKPRSIIVGGQQRVCTAVRTDAPIPLPLPIGLTGGFSSVHLNGRERWLVKWILLTPAIWPEIPPGTSKRGTERKPHPGGWLPNWVCPESGRVMLETIDPEKRRQRRSLNYNGKGYPSNPNIDASLVAAIVPKPIIVTGWALPNENDRTTGGAKSTHMAVPAGAVYYFEADSSQAAEALAAALNWHGNGPGDKIKNRRSTLLGEKGYGLGVCGTWNFHEHGRPK